MSTLCCRLCKTKSNSKLGFLRQSCQRYSKISRSNFDLIFQEFDNMTAGRKNQIVGYKWFDFRDTKSHSCLIVLYVSGSTNRTDKGGAGGVVHMDVGKANFGGTDGRTCFCLAPKIWIKIHPTGVTEGVKEY